MNKKVLLIFMSLLIGIVVPSFNNTVGAYSTTVRYSSPASSYYELSVPLVMAPGETATVSAMGTWDSQTVLEVTADKTVTLTCEDDNNEIDLEVYFNGIFEPGNDSNETEVSAQISVEVIDKSVIGTWEGNFTYTVSLTENTSFEKYHSGIIPEGGTYYVSATEDGGLAYVGDYSSALAVYQAGDAFPDEVNIGDVYVYGDYEYRYQCGYDGSWYNDYTSFNWGVTALSRSQTSYGEILTSINGKDVDNLMGVFYFCDFMEKSPKLPETTRVMTYAYFDCISLEEPPLIPDKVITLRKAFDNCRSLKTAPIIPSSVTDIDGAFYECTVLKTAPVIHENILTMIDAFSGCSSLSGAIEINAINLKGYSNALYGTNITEITGSISDELKGKILATK